MSTTVWFDADRTRFWRIPDEVVLPAGPLPILALTGHRQRVTPSALEPYLLAEDQIRRAVVEELVRAARHTGRALGTVTVDVAGHARARLPEHLSWAELEAQLGPMTTWADPGRARAALKVSTERLREQARRAGERVEQTKKLAKSTARSAAAIRKLVAENPELAGAAARLAKAWLKPSEPPEGDDRS